MKCCLCCRGFPAAPAKVSAPLGGGTDGRQGGRGAGSPRGAGGHEAGAKQSPLAARRHDGLIPSIPPPAVLEDPGAIGDIHLTPLFHPQGLRGRCKQPLPGLRATGRGDENHPARTGNRFPPGSAAQRPSQPKTVPASTGTHKVLGCWCWTVPGTSHKGFQRCRRCRAGFMQLLCFLKQPRHPLNARPKRTLIFKQWVEQASTRTHSLANI